MEKNIIDLSWGCPVVIRQALSEEMGEILLPQDLNSLNYTPHLGNPNLIEQLKDLAYRHSGRRPRHLMVTCGATGAINAALYALRERELEFCLTNRRYYSLYPTIIGMADLIMTHDVAKRPNAVTLVDSPSNPDGSVFPFEGVDVWDAAYASKPYSSGGHVPFKWKIMCGSLSKTLGLSGLRLGWVSTDDDEIARCLSIFITGSYIGLSKPSMQIAEHVLDKVDMDKFENRAKVYLDSNREEMQKLLDKFGQGNVPTRGMFGIVQLGAAEKKALEKANIVWQSGLVWGEDETWARLNIGQTRELVREAVKRVIK